MQSDMKKKKSEEMHVYQKNIENLMNKEENTE